MIGLGDLTENCYGFYDSQPFNIELSMIEQYKTDIQSSKSLISSATNTIKFQTIPLNKKIGDDEDLLAFVNAAIQTCQTLAPTKNRPKVSRKKNYSDPHHGHHH